MTSSIAPTNADYFLGTLEGWGAFTVVHFREIAEISRLFSVEIVLMRVATLGPVDLDGLIDTGATLAIKTATRWRFVQGIIDEIEEMDRTEAVLFYRVVLAPHLARARYRTACRTFQDQSISEVVAALLENRAPGNESGASGLARMSQEPSLPDTGPQDFTTFDEPSGQYRLLLTDARFSDRTYRHFLVQYNESDFDFLSRILEEEGLAYYFEHGLEGSVLTVTDSVSGSPLFFRSDVIQLHPTSQQLSNDEGVRYLREALRARSRAVRFRQYLPAQPLSRVEAETSADSTARDAAEHYEFPCYEGRPIDGKACAVPSKLRLERFEAERSMAQGEGTLRSLEPAVAFSLHDARGMTDDRTLLPVRVDMTAVQVVLGDTLGLDDAITLKAASPSVTTRFLVLPAKVAFRPPLTTPRPRIAGVQPAVVTAEEFLPGKLPEINANADGAVRVRFPWDQRPVRPGVPSSTWVRVSQHWAGIGYGALHTPRVGHAVLVAFHDGDPNRPVVVGRMYSDQMPIPYDPSQRPTVSTLKSQSSPDGGNGFNEFRFEDLKGKEEVFLHAQRELNEVVLGSHSTSVGGDQSNSVGHDRFHDVKGNESVHVHGVRVTNFDTNETHTVGDNRVTTIGDTDDLTVGSNLNTKVGANETRAVGGDRTTAIGAEDKLEVGADHVVSVGNNELRTVAVARETTVGTMDNVTVGTVEHHTVGAEFQVDVNGCTLTMTPGLIVLNNGAGAQIVLAGGSVFVSAAGGVFSTASGASAIVSGGAVALESGGAMALKAGGDINAAAPNIKLNG